jgi:hypothetical protein
MRHRAILIANARIGARIGFAMRRHQTEDAQTRALQRNRTRTPEPQASVLKQFDAPVGLSNEPRILTFDVVVSMAPTRRTPRMLGMLKRR